MGKGERKTPVLKLRAKTFGGTFALYSCMFVLGWMVLKDFYPSLELSRTFSSTSASLVVGRNNLNFDDGNCDFSTLKVKFKYDKIEYENEKLSIKQKRTDKMQKIMDNNE